MCAIFYILCRLRAPKWRNISHFKLSAQRGFTSAICRESVCAIFYILCRLRAPKWRNISHFKLSAQRGFTNAICRESVCAIFYLLCRLRAPKWRKISHFNFFQGRGVTLHTPRPPPPPLRPLQRRACFLPLYREELRGIYEADIQTW